MRALGAISHFFAGRWEVPLALGAVAVTSVTLFQLRPKTQGIDFDSVMADVKTLEQAEAFFEATDAAASLLELNPPLARAQRATVHEFLASAIHKRELVRGTPNIENVELIISHLRQAERLGVQPSSASRLYAAQAHEWLGQVGQAIEAYRSVLGGDPTLDETRSSNKGLVKLLEHRAEDAAERRRALRSLLEDEGISASYLWWAIQYSLREALDAGDTVQARADLTRYGDRLKRSDLKGYYDYLWAWVYLAEGRLEEAAPLVHWVDDWLSDGDRERFDMGEAAYLPAMNRWLLGEIHLAEERPQQALEAFEEVARLPNAWTVYVAAAVGRGKALLHLNRDAAALEMYRDAVRRIGVELPAKGSDAESVATKFSPDYRIGMAGVARLRESLTALAAKRRAQQRYEETVGYLSLALQLTERGQAEQRRIIIERLADANVRAAEADQDSGDRERGRTHREKAGRLYETAASLARFDEPRVATFLWMSAEQYDLAGRIRDAQRILRRFVDGRSYDPRYPEALLRLGEAVEADGELAEAISWYQRVVAQFPRLREAARARVLTAGCHVALGQNEQAEAILTGLLDDDNIAPESRAFRDALHALCDLLYNHERYAEAISRLEDLLSFYPEDPDRFRSRFMLGDSYRKNALRHRDRPAADVEPAALNRLVSDRLRRAAGLFEELLAEIKRQPEPDEATRLYERLALFYRGDSLFDLNEPQSLQAARAVYQRAAARYAREPAALTAQVQLSNIFLRQGRVAEAARAIEHARWLLDSISDERFVAYDDGIGRAYWQDYLATVAASHLFSDVFNSRP